MTSLRERIIRYLKNHPDQWVSGGELGELAHALPERYKHDTTSRRARELAEEGLLLRKEDKSPRGKIKTVFYRYDNTD